MKLLHGIFALLFALLLLMIFVWDVGWGESKITSVWALDDGEKVQRDNFSHFMKISPSNRVWDGSKVKIFGLRNEIVAFQLVLENQSGSQATNIDVIFDTLQSGANYITNGSWNGNLMNYAGHNIELFNAVYFNSTAPQTQMLWPSASYPVSSLPGESYVGWLPDCLVPADGNAFASDSVNDIIKGFPTHIPNGKNQTVWADVYIPKTAPGGTYTGNIYITEWGDTNYTIPVELTVYEATLSDTTHFKHFTFFEGSNINGAYRGDLGMPLDATTRAYMHRHYRLMHRHRHALVGNQALYTYNNFTTYWGQYFSGTGFIADSGYAGPGVGVGMNTFVINMYEQIITKAAGESPSIRTTYGMGAGNAATWQASANAWGNWFASNAPSALLMIHVAEEPSGFDWNANGIKQRDEINAGTTGAGSDSGRFWYGLRTVCDWLIAGSSPGKDIRRLTTGPNMRRYNGYSKIDYTSPNRITAHSTPYTAGWEPGVGREGIHIRSTTTADALPNESDENVSQGLADGDIQGVYNGAWPAWGYFEQITYPGIAARAPFWCFRRYPDTITFSLQWESFYHFRSSGSRWTAVDASLGGNTVYPGLSPYVASQSRGVDGPMPSVTLKAARRGLQDYEYFWLADSLGVPEATLQTILQRVVPNAFDDFDVVNYPSWNYIPFKIRGHEYELVRRELADTINARLGNPITPPPSVSLTASPSSLSAADSVGFNWTATDADSIIISHGKDGASGWRTLTYAASGTDSIWIAANITVTVRVFNSDLDSASSSASVVVSAATPELITNGDFEDADITVAWTKSGAVTLSRSTASPTINTAKASCVLANPITDWSQLYLKAASSFSLTAGQEYRLRFAVYSTSAAQVHVRVLKNVAPYTNYGLNKAFDYGTSAWTRIDTVFTVGGFSGTTTDAYIQFLFDYGGTDRSTPGSTVFIDSVSLIAYTGSNLTAPTISFPPDGSTGVDTAITVTWSAVTGVLGYHAYMDTLADFSTQWGDTGADNAWAVTGLDTNQLHYARVRGYDDYGNGPFSDTTSFTTRPGAPTDSVTLLLPGNKKFGRQVDATLSWTAVPGAYGYDYQILTDTTLADSGEVFWSLANVILAGSNQQAGQLSYRLIYFWRVRLVNQAGAGPWSAWREFKTAAEEALRERRTF